MSIDTVENKIRLRLSDIAGMRCKVKFDLGEEGVLHVDATQSPPVLTRHNEEADVTIGMTPENMLALLEGALNPTIAYTMGKLKVQGSMGLALKLSSILED